MILLQKKKNNKIVIEKEEFGPELSPDDLDIREDNDLTEEQFKNSNEVNNLSKTTRNNK